MSDNGICEYCKYKGKDIVERPCLHCAANLGAFEFDLQEHDAKVKAEAIDECAEAFKEIAIKWFANGRMGLGDITILAKQLKEKHH